MNVFDDVLDATVVSHSAVGHFTTAHFSELLVARTNVLSVYHAINEKLALAHEFKLHAEITDIALVPQQNSELQCMLLGTGAAKLSLVRFDTQSQTLETLSLHYYEDKFKEMSITEIAARSKLRMEPSNRCAMLFNNDCLAILPLTPDETEEEEEQDDDNLYTSNNKRQKTVSTTPSITPGEHLKSSVMVASQLHSDVKNTIDVQFLQSFNKPTVGLLYQPKLAWCGNEKVVSNTTKFTVLTLDIETGKSTKIGHNENLPNDLHTIIPLSNASVLVGTNELIYVDNTGALQCAILLNSYAAKNISTRIVDKSSSQTFLNEPIVWYSECVNNREFLLLMDQNGEMYNVELASEGRLLKNFDVEKLAIVNETFKHNYNPTCISALTPLSLKSFNLFIGFNSGDSLVVKLNNLQSSFEKRQVSQLAETIEEDDDYDYLYGNDDSRKETTPNTSENKILETTAPFDIEIMDRLINIGPITSLTVGKASSIENRVEGLPNPNKDELSIVTTSGNKSGSHLCIVQPSVQPLVQQALKFTAVTRIWNLRIKNKDKYLVTTDTNNAKSDVFEIDQNFTLFKSIDFKRNAATVEISIIGNGKRIIQATTKGLFLFDTSFKRLMTINFDFEVVHVSILDPFILLTNSKGEIKIYELEPKHKKRLSKVRLPEALEELIVTSGVILKSNMCNEYLPGLDASTEEQLLFTFVTADNQIIFFIKNHNDTIFQLNGIDQLKEMLFISTYQLPEEINPDPSIKQVMINKLGKNHKEEYLTILTFGGEIYQYRKSNNRHSRFHKNSSSDLLITGASDNAYAKGVSSIERIAYYLPNYHGYSAIVVSGNVPYIIIKEDHATPKIFKFTNIPLVSLTPWGKGSAMCVDDIKSSRVVTLDLGVYYGNKLPLKKVDVEDVLDDFGTLSNVTYHEKSQMFIVSYSKEIDYEALSEEGERLVGYEDNLPHAKGFKSGILLINPRTWNIIDKIEYDQNSLINDMKTMRIQLNSKTKRKREYLVVGNTFVRDEDIGTMGSFYLYDITEVVPEPGKPDTNYKLKEVFHEEFRGAVTSVCEISGRFMISQSQKVLVRDVQEDNSVVPVAFLDVPVFVTDSKSFSNLLIIGDAMQGFQFIGFDAEPYRMIPLGRSVFKFETVSLEFLVNNGDVYFLVTDRNNILHVLKYAPDEPNSLSGQKLVHCTSFNLYSRNTCMKLLPKNEEFTSTKKQSFQVIGGQTDGSIYKIVPLSESSYRRLYVIQQQLIDKEHQLAGLNPRMERLKNDFYQFGHMMRPMLDFTLIKKFSNLPIHKRTQVATKAGRQAQFNIWRDLIDIEYSLWSLSGS